MFAGCEIIKLFTYMKYLLLTFIGVAMMLNSGAQEKVLTMEDAVMEEGEKEGMEGKSEAAKEGEFGRICIFSGRGRRMCLLMQRGRS